MGAAQPREGAKEGKQLARAPCLFGNCRTNAAIFLIEYAPFGHATTLGCYRFRNE